MKYILDNKSDSIKSIEENNVNGLEIKAKRNDSSPIKSKKILLVGIELKDAYIKQKVDKKLEEILMKMNYILESDDTSSGMNTLVLDEIQRLKGIVINKYHEHLVEEEYKKILKKILLVEENFKRKYDARQIYKEMLMENMDESIGKGR